MVWCACAGVCRHVLLQCGVVCVRGRVLRTHRARACAGMRCAHWRPGVKEKILIVYGLHKLYIRLIQAHGARPASVTGASAAPPALCCARLWSTLWRAPRSSRCRVAHSVRVLRVGRRVLLMCGRVLRKHRVA